MAYRQYYLKSLSSKVPIGKYKNMTVQEVISMDITYIKWLSTLENVRIDNSIVRQLEVQNWLAQ